MNNGSALNHPHIVRFHGAFIQSGMPPALCMLLEYAAGGTLEEDIRHQRHLGQSYDSVVIETWLAQLAMAVNYMHAMHMLHRDLTTGTMYCAYLLLMDIEIVM